MHTDWLMDRRWHVLLALTTATLFLLLHPYMGLVHDARLYTLQALNFLHPEIYGNDAFLRFGSQDDYTLFPPIHAGVIALLGIEPAATFLTFFCAVLFMVAAWVLARTFLPARQSLVCLLLLVLIPAHYGPSRIFHYLEAFVSPRQLAECLVLLSVAAWFRGWRRWAAGLAGSAVLIHPIIGLSGTVLVAAMAWPLTTHWRKLWPVAAAGVVVVLLALLGWLRITKLQFDADWYQLVMRRSYLKLANWSLEDAARAFTVLATLAAASTSLRGRLQALASATLTATTSLLLLAWIGGDLLRVILVVQAQTWRVLWLASVVAIVLLPPLFSRCWRAGPMERSGCILLATAWATPVAIPALVATLIGVTTVAFSRAIPARQAGFLMAGAWIALALVTCHGFATAVLHSQEELVKHASHSPTLSSVLNLGHSGIVPASFVVAGALLIQRTASPHLVAGFAVAMAAATVLAARASAGTWFATGYGDEAWNSFSDWRSRIPVGSDVLWLSDDSLGPDSAMSTWLLLERPSFFTGTQVSNALFSRTFALEMRGRTQALWGRVPFMDPLRPADDQRSLAKEPLLIRPICSESAVKYLVTKSTFTDATPISASPTAPPPFRDYKLYICP